MVTKTTESETGNETSAIVIQYVTVEVLVDVTDGTVIDLEEQGEN